MNRYRCVMLRRSGASDIRVVRAEDEAAARAQLAAAGLDPVSVEAIGPSLIDTLRERFAGGRIPALPRLRSFRLQPVSYRPGPLSRMVLLILATIPITTALGAWGLTAWTRWQEHRLVITQASALARADQIGQAEKERVRARYAMTQPAISEWADHLKAALPEGAGLISLSQDEQATIILEVETADPDRLRYAIEEDSLLSHLREVGQTRTQSATLNVVFKGRL